MNALGYKWVMALVCVAAVRVASAQSTTINVDENFSIYQAFIRHIGTHFFADDGLPWSSYTVNLVNGEKLADGGCRFKSATVYSPQQARDGVRTQTVQQAINNETCQMLVRRGEFLAPFKLPRVSPTSPPTSVNVPMRASSSEEVSVSDTTGGYSTSAYINYRFDDGNNSIQIATGGIFVLGIGQAVVGFKIFPHDNPGDTDCLAGTSYNFERPGGRIVNDGSSRGWTSSYLGCGGFLYNNGSPISFMYGITNDVNSTVTTSNTTPVGALCNGKRFSNFACGGSSLNSASVFAATSGTMNNQGSICLPGTGVCAFDCRADGGLTIHVDDLSVKYNPAIGFIVVSDIYASGPLSNCRDNLRITNSQELLAFTPCDGTDPNCY